ncbi:hypothetical protein [Streptomyces sp. NPDC048191]|uniref:hypothetical protein n=1 Tax=Streptomyces sp. NPDC048191 TaxID=3155484 RepID=UPI0033E098BA
MKHPRINPAKSLVEADVVHDGGAIAAGGRLASRRAWPGSVAAPSSELFVQSAKDWLFCLGPSRWKFVPVLHRQPVLLARLVRSHLEAGMASATLNGRTARDGLAHLSLKFGDVADFIDVTEQEYRYLQALALQVRLVEAELQRRSALGGQPKGPECV